MRYDFPPQPAPVVKPGEFVFAAAALEHGHIHGQTSALIGAGATLRWVHDPDPAKVAAFRRKFPQARAAPNFETILDDPDVHLVAAACVPNERGPLGMRVMDAGKDYFCDKCPFTTLDQLESARARAAATGRKYMVYYSERLHVECAVFAGQLIADGVIGRVVQTIGTGPHRVGDPPVNRPAWFFDHARYGGILCDIGSHQSEQFLAFTGAGDATVNHSAVGNFAYADFPELEDFGEASLTADNGASGYYRVDWLTPTGLRSWGDGRTFILGTKGFIEFAEIPRSHRRGPRRRAAPPRGRAGRAALRLRRQGRIPVLRPTDSRRAQPHRERHDAGPRLQGRRVEPARPGRGQTVDGRPVSGAPP